MRFDHLYDAPSITARCLVEDRLAIAAREQLIHEARQTRRRPAIVGAGHLLVRLGQRLQAIARHPTYQEETVQWFS